MGLSQGPLKGSTSNPALIIKARYILELRVLLSRAGVEAARRAEQLLRCWAAVVV